MERQSGLRGVMLQWFGWYTVPVLVVYGGSTSSVVYIQCSVRQGSVVGLRLFITFHVRRSRGEMYIGHACRCVCLYVHRRIPTLLYGLGCNLGNGRGASSSALFGGFAIAARVSLLWQHSAEREMSTSAYTRSVPGDFLSDVTSSAQYDRRWFYNTRTRCIVRKKVSLYFCP